MHRQVAAPPPCWTPRWGGAPPSPQAEDQASLTRYRDKAGQHRVARPRRTEGSRARFCDALIVSFAPLRAPFLQRKRIHVDVEITHMHDSKSSLYRKDFGAQTIVRGSRGMP